MAEASDRVRHALSSWALIAALVCFSVALLLDTHVLRGSSAITWKEGGFIAIVVALLCGSRP